MAKKSGSLRTKRSNVPSFWKIPKKKKKFFVRTQPGAHPKEHSYPLLVLIRDLLGFAKTRKEVTMVLNEGKILVDGKIVKSTGRPVGLMDVIEIPTIGRFYRLVPQKGGLTPVEINESEKALKICLVRSKKSFGGGKIAYGLHDGRVIRPETDIAMNSGDSCIISFKKQELKNNFRIAEGEMALLVGGDRSGELATVEDLKPGTFSRDPIATVRLSDGSSSELPTRFLMPLGRELPPITVTVASAK